MKVLKSRRCACAGISLYGCVVVWVYVCAAMNSKIGSRADLQ